MVFLSSGCIRPVPCEAPVCLDTLRPARNSPSLPEYIHSHYKKCRLTKYYVKLRQYSVSALIDTSSSPLYLQKDSNLLKDGFHAHCLERDCPTVFL